MSMLRAAAAGLAAIVMASAVPAGAIVYSGFQTAGPNGFGTITVTTDDSLGVLTAANIVSFAITSNINGVAYSAVSGGPGSDTTIVGSGLVATPTALLFDFGSDGLFGIADFVPGNTGFCVDAVAAAFTCTGDPPSLGFFTALSASDFISVSERRTGVQAIATAVPEPATWATMIVGFGIAGGALRRRPTRAVA